MIVVFLEIQKYNNNKFSTTHTYMNPTTSFYIFIDGIYIHCVKSRFIYTYTVNSTEAKANIF